MKPLAEREPLYHQPYKCKQVQRGALLNVTVICCFDKGYAHSVCSLGVNVILQRSGNITAFYLLGDPLIW